MFKQIEKYNLEAEKYNSMKNKIIAELQNKENKSNKITNITNNTNNTNNNTNNIINNITNNNLTLQIQINAFGKEDLSHMSEC
jgi:hypothetical protein